MPANGGNADTLGGKSANEFASISDIDNVKELIGDEKVSDQIDAAMQESVADWNQNDETAPDYVKNRTHYEEVTEDEVTITIKPNDVIGATVADQIYAQRETAKYAGEGFDKSLSYWFAASDGTGDFLLYDGINVIRGTRRFDNTIQFYTKRDNIDTDLDGERVTVDVTYIGEVKKVHKLDIKYLPIATNEEIIDLLMQENMLPAITDSDGSMLSDENGNILLW